ncbi:MAG TPA: ribonuclease H-like domain-containing protein [Vicinamibacterales bacterium]|nr:ribonuclease H-like domain-containing protein [Vicinamibacterales bacterium]
MRDLASRLRRIVRQDAERERAAAPARELTYVADLEGGHDTGRTAAALGGAVHGSPGSACVVVDRSWSAGDRHGHREVGGWTIDAEAPIALFDPRLKSLSSWADRVVFFDVETTGLSGGAGTLAFLAGCGWFEGDGFRVRQFFLSGPAGEHAMLDALGAIFDEASLLVTFNGRSFDVPVMEMRWAFHRRATPTDDLPHLDMLPPARRLWGIDAEHSCSLTSLEQLLLGVHRHGDVPGFEIPTRYFQFLRTGDPATVEGVLEHNRLDVISLAAVTAHALRLARGGPEACRLPGEQLALGRLYERAGDADRALRSYELAGAASGHRGVRRQALARLAELKRRARQYDEAAAAWQDVLELSEAGEEGTPLERRATEALAIHHEHRVRDLDAARRYAEALTTSTAAGAATRAHHRLRRLDRKIKLGAEALKIFD